jgi:hypothetical protein
MQIVKYLVPVIILMFSFTACDYEDCSLSVTNKTSRRLYLVWDYNNNLKRIFSRDSTTLIHSSSYTNMKPLEKGSNEKLCLTSGRSYWWENFFEDHEYLYIFALDSLTYDGDFEKTCHKNKCYKIYKIDYKSVKDNSWNIELR